MKKEIQIAVLLFTVMLVSFSVDSNAQTFEEWKKQREKEMQQFKLDREKQIQQLAEQFDKYVEQRDKEFSDYLKTRWKQFQVFQGLDVPEEPKPDVPPEYVEPEMPKPPAALPVIIPENIPSEKAPRPILPRITKQEPDQFPVNTYDFDFYGYTVVFDCDKALEEKFKGDVSEVSISDYFTLMSKANYNHLIEQMVDYRNSMNLNDWAYYLLIRRVAENITGQDEKTSELLTWFILLRSGYRVKIAFFENELYLLIPSINQIYGKNFFQLDGFNYYLLKGELMELYTYEADFPDAQKIFDLNIYHPISFGETEGQRSLNFSYQGLETPVTITYNKNAIDFYNDYPQADIKIYFDAAVSPLAKESLASALVPLIEGKSELDAVNLLLNFVQTAFEYKTDQEQFGYEKFFFAEEAFYYPYCDCEDRSVLFSYLVESLLGLEVIGLNYPGHIATAVKFNEPVKGDYVTFRGKDYVVSDPTYINAPVGLTMPQYADVTANIIPVDNNYSIRRSEENIWQEIIAAGGNRAANSGDIIVDDNGEATLTGYVSDNFSYSGITANAGGKPSAFVIHLNSDMSATWFAWAEVNDMAYGYSIVQDVNGNTFVGGTFRGEMNMGDKKLECGEVPDVFVAKFDDDGDLLWMERANIDTVNQNNYLNFVSRFGTTGEHLGNELFFETGDFNNYGLHISPEGEICFAGAFNKTTGMNIKEMSTASAGEFNIITAIKEENDKLISENYDRAIAGLFAVINLIKNSGISIPGSDAQLVLDKYNPQFKTKVPDIYKNIGRIQFLKNSEGIVTVQTEKEKDIYFDMMRVQNNSKIKISYLENGDAQVDILSGVRVGKAFIWYPLNRVLLYKQNGNMLFDYDSDHTQRVLNIHDDILY